MQGGATEERRSTGRGKPGRGWLVAAGLALAAGLGVRLYDLTDAPLDFHETRQLGSAIIARGMYYQLDARADPQRRAEAIELWHAAPTYEPPLQERLVALLYLATGAERLWIARIVASVIWCLGGIGVWSAGRRIAGAAGGAAGLGYFVLLPYGIVASRSFQPDPAMVALIVFSVLAMLRWLEHPSWGRALAAGALAGLAILVKAVAVFPVLGALAGAGLWGLGLRAAARSRQLWVLAVLSLAPAGLYHLLFIQNRAEGLFAFWVTSFTGLWTEPSFYVRWVQMAKGVVGFGALLIALLGVIAAPRGGARGLLAGAWIGYGLYGFALPYQVMTHDYYHLMLIGLVALSLASALHPALERAARAGGEWRLALIGVLVFAAALPIWDARVTFAQSDYRPEAGGWRRLGAALPRDGDYMALTHAYGMRLAYYGWLQTTPWPTAADLSLETLRGQPAPDYAAEFARRTHGKRYFLVTLFDELGRQPELRTLLYEGFEIAAEGDGFILFDLQRPRAPAEDRPGAGAVGEDRDLFGAGDPTAGEEGWRLSVLPGGTACVLRRASPQAKVHSARGQAVPRRTPRLEAAGLPADADCPG